MGNGLPPPIPLNNGHALSIFICAVVFPVIATLCVIGRIVSRRMKRINLGADDYTIILALVASYGHMLIVIMSVIYGGFGHHISQLNDENRVIIFKLLTAAQFSFSSSLGLAKISICFLLIRLFSVKGFKTAAWCVMVYNICWIITGFLVAGFLCRPFAYFWDKTIEGGKCGSLEASSIAVAATDVLGDLLIIVLPMPWIWRLENITSSTKFGLSFVFALGFLDIIIAIFRMVYFGKTSFPNSPDFTFNSSAIYVWSVIEPSMAIIVASAGLLRPLFVALFNLFSGNESAWRPTAGSVTLGLAPQDTVDPRLCAKTW